MSDLLVSVIVPVYNGIKYIEKTLQTIINQNYSNIEVILIDDGSTDDSLNLITNLSKTDKRIKTFHKENGGVACARNFGIEQSQGEYIAFCDQDDLWHKHKLSEQMPLFLNNEIGLVYCGALIENVEANRIINGNFSGFLKGRVFDTLIRENFITCCSVIVRKNILNDVGNFDIEKSLMGVDDWHLWLKIALVSQFDYVRQHLCTHIFHDSNYSSNDEKMHIAELVCIEKIKPLAIQYRVEVNWSDILYEIHLRYIISYIHSGAFQAAAETYKKAYQIKPSPSLYLNSLIYSISPKLILKTLQQVKRKLM